MPRRQDSKKVKLKNIQVDDQLPISGIAEKIQEGLHKNIRIHELSPYSPIMRTLKKSYDKLNPICDFAMIETPNIQKISTNIIDQLDYQEQGISKVLNWNCDDEKNSNQEDWSGSDLVSPDEVSEEFGLQKQSYLVKEQARDNKEDLGANFEQEKNVRIILNKKIKQIKQKDRKRIPPVPLQKKKIICNCKKTQCLKLYCDCFRENQICSPSCNCTGCHNTQANQVQRNNVMLTLMERNPEAFKPKLEEQQHAKGCHCKKSSCLKKYCECYQAGLSCSEHCKCQDCKNCSSAKIDIQTQKNI